MVSLLFARLEYRYITPSAWEHVCNNTSTAAAYEIASNTLEAFDAYIPGLACSKVNHVAAGVIFSWGKTDINDPESELHERYNIGVETHDGYFSINTGKFTCAPLFAQQLLDKINQLH